MPELPEIRAHAERLDARYANVSMGDFTALSFTALKTVPAADVFAGQRLSGVSSRGKYLLLEFDSVTFVVHLMQAGRLRQDTGKAARPKGGIARWTFDDGSALLLTEAGTERRAGVWVLSGDVRRQAPLADLGPEADQLHAEELRARLRSRSGRLHTVLRDQRVLAGLGRRLANEICHRASLSPFAATGRLGAGEAERLAEAIAELVAQGLRAERARDDMSASADRPAAVHGRIGDPCLRCGDPIRAVEYRDYTIAYCATCQTGGRILADNTTSKFLK